MYKCDYFAIHELVPPKVYAERGELAWELLDEKALVTLDQLRKKLGRTTVNNYKFGGDREWSGLRTPDSPYYSKYSQHSFGRAFDCIFEKVTAEEARQYIKLYPEIFPYLNSIEEEVSWLHFDVRNCVRIKTYSP